MFALQEPHNVNSSMQQAIRSSYQPNYGLDQTDIFRNDLNFLTLTRRRKRHGGLTTTTNQSNQEMNTKLDNDNSSQDTAPASLLLDGGDGFVIKKIPPKVAPKPRQPIH